MAKRKRDPASPPQPPPQQSSPPLIHSSNSSPIDPIDPITSTTKKRQRQPISCNLCRTIKRKCDGKNPCGNCIKKNQECIYPAIDKRRNRYSTEYIQLLEDGYNKYRETLQFVINNKQNPNLIINKLNELPNDLPTLLIESTSQGSIKDEKSISFSDPQQQSLQPPAQVQPFPLNQQQSVSVYGPSSIYDGALLNTDSQNSNSSPPGPPSNPSTGLSNPSPTNYLTKINSAPPPVPSSSNAPATTASSNSARNTSSPQSIGGNSPASNLAQLNPLSPSVLTSPKVQELLSTSFKFLHGRFITFIMYEKKTHDLYQQLCQLNTPNNPNVYDKFNNLLYTYPNNQFLSPELIYALCLFGATVLNRVNEANYYYDLSKRLTFCDSYNIGGVGNSPSSPLSSSSSESQSSKISFGTSSFARIQTLVTLAIHDLSKGNLTTAWQLTGMAFRMGSDVGFDNSFKIVNDEDLSKLKNKLYWGCYIIDAFLAIIYGRNKMMFYQPHYPVFKNDVNNRNLRKIIDVFVFSDSMFTVIYHSIPYTTLEESKKNFIEKFNKVKEFNQQLSDWKQNLAPESYWNIEIIRQSSQGGQKDFGLSLVFFVVILILNKPFLHISQGNDLKLVRDSINEFELILSQFQNFDSYQSIIVIYTLILMTNSLFAILNQVNVKERSVLINQLNFFVSFLINKFDSDTWIIVKNPIQVLSERLSKLLESEKNNNKQQSNLQVSQQPQQSSQFQPPPPQPPQTQVQFQHEYYESKPSPYDKRSPTTPILENLVHGHTPKPQNSPYNQLPPPQEEEIQNYQQQQPQLQPQPPRDDEPFKNMIDSLFNQHGNERNFGTGEFMNDNNQFNHYNNFNNVNNNQFDMFAQPPSQPQPQPQPAATTSTSKRSSKSRKKSSSLKNQHPEAQESSSSSSNPQPTNPDGSNPPPPKKQNKRTISINPLNDTDMFNNFLNFEYLDINWDSYFPQFPQ